MTNLYATDLPCRPIKDGFEREGVYVMDAKDAARVFADRYARRIYGKRGLCRTVRLDSWTGNGRHHVFEAFIGVPCDDMGTVSGKNIRLTVTVAEG